MQLCIKPTERYKQKSYVFASYYQMSTNVYHVKLCHDSFFFTLDFKSLESSLELVHKLTESGQITKSGPGNGIFLSVFLQDQNFWGSLMTPCLKIWGSLTNLEGQNFFNV